MSLKDEETDGHRAVRLSEKRMRTAEELVERYEIAQRLTHLLAVDSDHVIVHPIIHGLLTIVSHRLGDLTLMMREHQVHSAAMYIECLSEVFLTHCGTLKMPSREPLAPRRWPMHDMLRRSFLPQSEVSRIALLLLTVQRSRGGEKFVDIAPGELTVTMIPVILRHIEIHRSVRDIGISAVKDSLDVLDLLYYMPGCMRLD